jgi:hypothetical protein
MRRIAPPSCKVVQMELEDGTLIHTLVDCGNPKCPSSSAK